MAIGVPTRKKQKDEMTVRLTYSGKKSESDMMKTPKSELINI